MGTVRAVDVPNCHVHRLHTFDERLRLQQGAVGREGVEGVDHQAAGAGVGGHEPERGQSEPVVRVQQVQEPPLAAVGEQLFMDAGEEGRGQGLGLALIW